MMCNYEIFYTFMQVILFVCDGAKPNRKFLKSLGKESEMKHGVVYKTVIVSAKRETSTLCLMFPI